MQYHLMSENSLMIASYSSSAFWMPLLWYNDIIPVVIYNACMYNLSLWDAGVIRLDVGLGSLIHWSVLIWVAVILNLDTHIYIIYMIIFFNFCWMLKNHFTPSRWMPLAGEVSQLIFMEIHIVQTVVLLHACSPIVCASFFNFLYSLW